MFFSTQLQSDNVNWDKNKTSQGNILENRHKIVNNYLHKSAAYFVIFIVSSR